MLRLYRPNKEHMFSYIEYCIECEKNNIPLFYLVESSLEMLYKIYNDSKLMDKYGDRLILIDGLNRKGINLEDGFVPAGQFWLIENNKVLGIGNLRHYISPVLEVFAGHIGYSIKAGFWGKGLATALLRMLLNEAAKIDIKYALLTCDLTNQASRRVMEKNGGQYIDTLCNEIDGKIRNTSRFLIDTGLILNRKCHWASPTAFPANITDGQISLSPVKTVDEYGNIFSYYFNIFSGFTKVGWIVFRMADEPMLYFDGNIGYYISEKYRGKKYAEKACRLLKLSLAEFGIKVIYIVTDCQNRASRRVCENIGAELLEIVKKEKLMCRYRWILN